MAYLGLLIVPVFLIFSAVFSPTIRQEIIQAAKTSYNRTAAAIDQVRHDQKITDGIGNLQRQIAAYLLRQIASGIDKK